jgi:hypothetical protein
MVKLDALCLLMILRTVLLVVGGLELKIGCFVSATTAAASGHSHANRAATCGPGAGQSQCRDPSYEHSEEAASGLAPSRFQSGDIVELYNTESRDIQIVFPSLVKGHDGPGYRVTKTTDGKEVADIPAKHVHPYVPYQTGDAALCNIGDFKPARPIIVRCTVLEYVPAAARGAMVLQGRYAVRVGQTKANEEYETELPVWKLQRRYSPPNIRGKVS